MATDRSRLTTEKRNPRTADIDRRSVLEIVSAINAEDARVAGAVQKERRRIAATTKRKRPSAPKHVHQEPQTILDILG